MDFKKQDKHSDARRKWHALTCYLTVGRGALRSRVLRLWAAEDVLDGVDAGSAARGGARGRRELRVHLRQRRGAALRFLRWRRTGRLEGSLHHDYNTGNKV